MGAQNTAKTDTAQAVLDCGTNKCGKVTGNEQQACLCKNCKTQDQAAQSASCVCGMSDANSAAACQIYQRLNAKCSSVAKLSTVDKSRKKTPFLFWSILSMG